MKPGGGRWVPRVPRIPRVLRVTKPSPPSKQPQILQVSWSPGSPIGPSQSLQRDPPKGSPPTPVNSPSNSRFHAPQGTFRVPRVPKVPHPPLPPPSQQLNSRQVSWPSRVTYSVPKVPRVPGVPRVTPLLSNQTTHLQPSFLDPGSTL